MPLRKLIKIDVFYYFLTNNLIIIIKKIFMTNIIIMPMNNLHSVLSVAVFINNFYVKLIVKFVGFYYISMS